MINIFQILILFNKTKSFPLRHLKQYLELKDRLVIKIKIILKNNHKLTYFKIKYNLFS